MIGASQVAAAGTYNATTSIVTTGQAHQAVACAYEDLDPGTAAFTPYANPIAAENSLPGSLSSSWFGAELHANIAGYTDSLSYNIGDTVNFKINSNNIGFNVELVRVGYYNYVSFAARQIETIAGSPAVQPAPTTNSYGGKVCAWTTTASWVIPSTATPGIYVYNMRRTDNSAFVAQGIFVVKNTVPVTKQADRIMLATADFTWQAYNYWGAFGESGSSFSSYTGRSLYTGGGVSDSYTSRAFAVSYDRPNNAISATKQTYFWDSEFALINFLEGNGYYVDYYTSVDLDKDTTIPSKYGIAVSSGHSEYWTSNLQDAYQDARDAGTHELFLTSNTALWHVRFDPADTNRRTMICYKDSHDIVGYDGVTKYDPVQYTGTWRDIRANVGGVNNNDRRPESGLQGQWFIGNGDFQGMISVPDSYKTLPMWRNTPIASGVTITVRGSGSTALGSATTAISVAQHASTAVGDTAIMAVTFNGVPASLVTNGARILRQISDGTSQTTIVLTYQVVTGGTSSQALSWSNSLMASAVLTTYGNAAWTDGAMAITVDSGGTALHTTSNATPATADRWAICVFADSNTGGTTKTTSWTAGSGITSRASTHNAGSGGPWNSIALMDTNGAVTQAAHQYSATAEFANTRATTCILFLTPATTFSARTVGFEWDYLKEEEPTTPKNIVRLSDQLFNIRSQAANYNGDGYTGNSFVRYGMTLYKADSGAMVFCAGTWRYQFGLSYYRMSLAQVLTTVDTSMQQALINLIKDMGIGPTTLLSTTQNNNLTALVDPGASASPDDYGLTLSDPGYQNIFDVTVPDNKDVDVGTDATFGTVFTATQNGDIHGIRWYFPDTLPNQNAVGLLYTWTNDTAGTELARVTILNPQSGWNQMLFSSPVSIISSTKYVVAIWTADRAVNTPGLLTSPVTHDGVTAIADSVSAHNGKFVTGAGTPGFPTSSGSGIGYFADVLYVGNGTITFVGWGIPM